MKSMTLWRRLVCVMSVLCVTGVLVAADSVATTPVPRDGKWLERHEQQVANTAKGDVDLLMIGDSITQGWEGGGKEVWEKYYAPRKALNLGISGDRTEHVLWRLNNLPLDKIKPKAAIIMIGTNNLGHKSSTPAETADGIKAIVEKLREKIPGMRIVVLHVFPRDEKADGGMRAKVDELNTLFPPLLAKTRGVAVVDLNKTFLTSDGVLTKEVMPDALHPNKHGYELWAEAMEPTVKRLLRENGEEATARPRGANATSRPQRSQQRPSRRATE